MGDPKPKTKEVRDSYGIVSNKAVHELMQLTPRCQLWRHIDRCGHHISDILKQAAVLLQAMRLASCTMPMLAMLRLVSAVPDEKRMRQLIHIVSLLVTVR